MQSESLDYLKGFSLALLLTAIPFWLVFTGPFSRSIILVLIAICGVLQILVHLRFFLHLTFLPHNTWFLVSILFTVIILVIMVGGTLWILIDLNRHMLI